MVNLESRIAELEAQVDELQKICSILGYIGDKYDRFEYVPGSALDDVRKWLVSLENSEETYYSTLARQTLEDEVAVKAMYSTTTAASEMIYDPRRAIYTINGQEVPASSSIINNIKEIYGGKI